MKKLLYILLICFGFSATAQNASTIQQLLDEGVTLGELIDTGVSIEEFYGVEYEGGYIFEIDTTIHVCKVVNKTITNFNGEFYYWLGIGSYSEEIIGLGDDGEINTQLILDLFPTGDTNQSFAKWASITNLNQHSDWYLPSIQECINVGQNVYLDFQQPDFFTNDYFSCITSNQAPPTSNFDTWDNYCAVIQNYNLTVGEAQFDTGINGIQPEPHIYITRKFNYQSELTTLSPALESFLETYTPPVMEEEVVSDANSFDVLNPLSYNGEFESVHYSFMNGNYTVPSGKTLIIYIISNPTSIETQRLLIDDIKHLVVACCQTNLTNDIGKPIIVGGNKTLSIQDYSSINISFHGVLVNTAFESVHIDVANSNYIVPNGKTLIVSEFCSENSVSLYADDNYHSEILGGSALGDNNNTITYTFSGNTTISSNPPAPYFLHGILIDNSNYTYATDYELIDALNEGMDSLSTMSEEVALENDSISSQNAILTEENETLMAIEYNYDSLQYVTEYLYSQVFDLQQELLVPNIDVDMAIGWNMIGFSCPEDKSAEDALLSIVDEIIIFKDNNGSVYMPEFGFNGIGDLTPGHGYQLKISTFILDFNICE